MIRIELEQIIDRHSPASRMAASEERPPLGWRRRQVGISLIVGVLATGAFWVTLPAAGAEHGRRVELNAGQVAGYELSVSAYENVAAPRHLATRFSRSAGPEPGEAVSAVEEESTFPWGIALLGAAQTVFVIGLAFFLRSPATREGISWGTAYLRAGLIFLYFVLATAWLPSWIVSWNAVAGASRWVSDLVGSAAWLVPLAVGFAALRWLQKRERI